MEKSFLTVAGETEVLKKVKDSKFYGNTAVVKSEKEVKNFTEKIKGRYRDASHNVTAYKIGCGGQVKKYSDDDSEPAGSSGPPVLEVIDGRELTNVIVVVSRYFGGTKLGIGGLIRAYGDTARLVINKAGTKKMNLIYKLQIIGNYNITGDIMGQIEAFSGKILASEYNREQVKIECLLKPEKVKAFRNKLIKISGNQVKLKKLKEFYSSPGK